MELRKHRTPSGLPPSNFEEGTDIWDFVRKPDNELELILKHGVWSPEIEQRSRRRNAAALTPRGSNGSLFATNSPDLKTLELITWWERRRVTFNGILIGFGALTFCLLWSTTVAFRYKMVDLPDAISRGETLLDPYALAWLLIVANAVFTLAWGFDLLYRAIAAHPCHHRQSASLLQAALWVSLTWLGFVAVSLLHFAIAH